MGDYEESLEGSGWAVELSWGGLGNGSNFISLLSVARARLKFEYWPGESFPAEQPSVPLGQIPTSGLGPGIWPSTPFIWEGSETQPVQSLLS